MSEDITDRGLVETAASIRAGEVSSVECTRACLARIERLQPATNAFIRIDADEALGAAARADEAIARILAGSWRGRARDTIDSSGYVAHTLEAALWSVARTGDFRGAVLLAANLADDADTVAAVTGQLAGALYGLSGIPAGWLDRVAWKDRLLEVADRLVAPSLGSPPPPP